MNTTNTNDTSYISYKKKVNGILLILSCQKYKNTRLKDFSLRKKKYNNWKVIYVIGDLFMEKNYILDGNFLYVKCEDSYLHLLKKLVLSIKYLNEIFIISKGILRCGDDLIINEKNLLNFLDDKTTKYDYYGQNPKAKNYICSENTKNELKKIKHDNFMINYYASHPDDFLNPHHNLKDVNISLYSMRPDIYGAAGVIYYISNKACETLIQHMESINYNILFYDNFTKSYPYTIEDCGVSFIMYFNGINFMHDFLFYSSSSPRTYMLSDYTMVIKSDDSSETTIAKHTNKYK
jgi:hypothetical protein